MLHFNRDVQKALLDSVFGAHVVKCFNTSQVDANYKLINKCPLAFQSLVDEQSISMQIVASEIEDAGYSAKRNELVPYHVLLGILKKLIGTDLQLTKRDHFDLLQATCRAPENQQCSIIVFLRLYAEWYYKSSALTRSLATINVIPVHHKREIFSQINKSDFF